MGEQKEVEEMNQIQQPPWLVNNILFCYEGEKHTRNESERKKALPTTQKKTRKQQISLNKWIKKQRIKSSAQNRNDSGKEAMHLQV